MNDHDLLLIVTICNLLGHKIGPGDVEIAFKQAQESLKALRDWTPPAKTPLTSPHS